MAYVYRILRRACLAVAHHTHLTKQMVSVLVCFAWAMVAVVFTGIAIGTLTDLVWLYVTVALDALILVLVGCWVFATWDLWR